MTDATHQQKSNPSSNVKADDAALASSSHDANVAKAIPDPLEQNQLAKLLEEHKALLVEQQEERRFEREKIMNVWRAVLDYAQIGLKTIIVVNGAGVTGILAFLGAAAKAGPPHSFTPFGFRLLSISAGVFAFGVAAGFLATLFAYFNQYEVVWRALENGGSITRSTKTWTRRAAFVCVVAGLLAFIVGVPLAVWAFLSQPGQ